VTVISHGETPHQTFWKKYRKRPISARSRSSTSPDHFFTSARRTSSGSIRAIEVFVGHLPGLIPWAFAASESVFRSRFLIRSFLSLSSIGHHGMIFLAENKVIEGIIPSRYPQMSPVALYRELGQCLEHHSPENGRIGLVFIQCALAVGCAAKLIEPVQRCFCAIEHPPVPVILVHGYD
jgi:hypothetical protein